MDAEQALIAALVVWGIAVFALLAILVWFVVSTDDDYWDGA